MGSAHLTIDLDAIVANWRALDAMSSCETAAVVKADGYGLGAARVAKALAQAGVRRFFVAVAEEGAAVRDALGPNADILVFGGHMCGDTDMIHDLHLTPMLNSLDQLTRHFEALPNEPFGIQLDSGMNRLGIEVAEWDAVRDIVLAQNPVLVMSHLACADQPDHAMNAQQLTRFRAMTDGIEAPRSLAATGGILLGPQYHFDLTRPGIGLYGGQPFAQAQAVATLSLPVFQTRDLEAGETVGYSNAWSTNTSATIATLSGGYADGLMRALGNGATLWADDIACPLVGRVSMDLITVDISHLHEVPKHLDIIGAQQTVDDLAAIAGTIGYEILTSLGPRYTRRYSGGFAQ
ncbi:alanine racemase [Marinosulfonomonas sp. PRT-SC04]|nr:alanine racemase [Marinosulfonomonas sp. PRT-SC04]